MFSTLNQPAEGEGGRERERVCVHASCQCRTNNRDDERGGRGYDGERQPQVYLLKDVHWDRHI